MKYSFVIVPEDKMNIKKWQTTRLDRVPHAWDRLCHVASVIATNFVDNNWVFRKNLGSLTFQNKRDRHEVITVFIDAGNKLANEEGLRITPDPIVVAIELTHQPAYLRRLIRDDLTDFFKERYLNPEKGYSKRWLAPNVNDDEWHYYDIAFIATGQGCEFPVNDAIRNKIYHILSSEESTPNIDIADLLFLG